MLDPSLTSRLTAEELNNFVTKINKQFKKIPTKNSTESCAVSNMAHSIVIDRVFNLQLKYYVQDIETKKAAAMALMALKNSE